MGSGAAREDYEHSKARPHLRRIRVKYKMKSFTIRGGEGSMSLRMFKKKGRRS